MRSILFKILKQFYQKSLYFTLPVSFLFFYWASQTFERYHQFHLKAIYRYEEVGLARCGVYEWNQILRKAKNFFYSPVIDIDKSGVKRIDLFIRRKNLQELDENLPWSGMRYVKGHLIMPNDKPEKVSVKYRGDTNTHWAFNKKSFRVRLPREHLYEGMRAFNLIRPKYELLNAYTAMLTCEEMGMIVPKYDMVHLYLNDKFHGIYFMVEQMGETLLRRHHKMPGDLYKAELNGWDGYRGLNNQVFDHPSLWPKAAVNNHYKSDHFEPARKLAKFARMQDADQKVHDDLLDFLDLESWSKYLATAELGLLNGDNKHNWRLYYNPATARFETLAWDELLWLGDHDVHNIVTSDLHAILFKNQKIHIERMKRLHEFYQRNSDRQLLDKYDKMAHQLKPSLKLDNDLDEKSVLKEFMKFREELNKVHENNRKRFSVSRDAVAHQILTDGAVRMQLNGWAPLDKIIFHFKHAPKGNVKLKLKSILKDGDLILRDLSHRLSFNENKMICELQLCADIFPEDKQGSGQSRLKNVLVAKPAVVDWVFSESALSRNLSGVEVLMLNETIPSREVKNLKLQPLSYIDGLAPFEEPAEEQVWSGVVKIEKTTTVDHDLKITAGTVLIFSEKASLIVKGKLTARGSRNKPITFKGKAGETWGALALFRENTSGSFLKHCNFKNGSGYKSGLIEFSGMLSIHGAREVQIEHCFFENNKLVDDQVHVIASEVKFSHCQFKNAHMDAVDIDISRAIIENCLFINSGNDSLDFMDSKGVVRWCEFEHSGDKGISVGEASTIFVENCLIKNANIAVEVKDSSIAWVRMSSFLNSTQSVNAYLKNWRYNGGGTMVLESVKIAGSRNPAGADSASGIVLYQTDLSLPVQSKHIKKWSDLEWKREGYEWTKKHFVDKLFQQTLTFN